MSFALHPEDNSLTTAYGAVSRCGVRRIGNQDSYLTDESLRMFVVADGVAGCAGGEIASALACGQILDTFENELSKIQQEDDREAAINAAVSQAFRSADRRIVCERTMEPFLSDMATTALLAFVDSYADSAAPDLGEGRLYIGNAGDCRALLVRMGEATQLTREHTIAAGLEEAGLLDHEQALHHPGRSILYINLGGSLYDGPQLNSCGIQQGDRIVLMTDGLTDVLSNDDVASIVAATPDAEAVANRLADMAIQKGAGDDVTCVVVDIQK